MLTFKGRIISFYRKNSNIPLTRADHIYSYRKKNAAVCHEYYSLCTQHSSLDKSMFTFTASGHGRGVYTKLRLINEVKKYLVHLINVTKADIYYFATIEMGHSFTNAHLHVQVWSSDNKSVQVIYDKVIKKFSLYQKRCKLSTPDLNNTSTYYDYVIKDFSKNLSDDDIWNLEQTKKRMRKTLGLKVRFYARSKGRYTQKAYRYFYRHFNVLREKADEYLDWFFSLFFRKQRVFITSTILLSLYINKGYVTVLFVSFFLVFNIVRFAPSTSPPILYSIMV